MSASVDHVLHRGHAHSRHCRHKEGHSDLCSGDWLSVGSRQLHPYGVAPLRGGAGFELKINSNVAAVGAFMAQRSPLPGGGANDRIAA